MKNILYLFVVISFSSCGQYTEKELYGNYVPVDYKNTYDTIQLNAQSIYHRKVYNKNGVLVLHTYGKWTLKNNQIKFDGFFLNLDRDLIKFPELVKDTNYTSTTNLENINKIIGFCVGYYDNENCYQKIE